MYIYPLQGGDKQLQSRLISVQLEGKRRMQKTKVNMGAGMVFGRTNAAAGVFLNIYNKRALDQRCQCISELS